MEAGPRISYELGERQVRLIQRILQGYDSNVCVGTEYDKSVIFKGLVYLGRKGKLVIVIGPLKALERDQASVN